MNRHGPMTDEILVHGERFRVLDARPDGRPRRVEAVDEHLRGSLLEARLNQHLAVQTRRDELVAQLRIYPALEFLARQWHRLTGR